MPQPADTWAGMAAEWAEYRLRLERERAEKEKLYWERVRKQRDQYRHQNARRYARDKKLWQGDYPNFCGHGFEPFRGVRIPHPSELRQIMREDPEDENDFSLLSLRCVVSRFVSPWRDDPNEDD